MYEEYFGLKRPPFKITPDTSLFFGGGKRRDILAALVYAVKRGEGIVKVVGEVGSGKTMLCRMLQQELPSSVEIIYIANPSVSAEDILFVMAHELELPVSKEDSKHEVMHLMQDYLVQRHIENKQVVLFIEEAQGMPLDTLEEIRLLSNLETDQNKLLQIILFGQPELDENLSIKSIRQLRERITHSFELLPLSSEEIHQYLNFRMQEVGYSGPELITFKLAKKIKKYSGGLLRRINIIADKVLLAAFAESTHNLGTKHVMAAAKDSGFASVQSSNTKIWPVLSLIISIVLALGFYQFQPQWLEFFSGKPIVQPAVLVHEIKHSIEPAGLMSEPTKNETVTETDEELDRQPELTGETIVDPPTKALFNVPSLGLNSAPEITKQAENFSPLETTATRVTTKATAASKTANTKINLSPDYKLWLDAKIVLSRAWLAKAEKKHVSIQVMTHTNSAAEEMVRFLRKRWPLDLNKTYVFEVQSGSRKIYRVFYDEFDSVPDGTRKISKLPQSIRVNGPYLHSIYKMQDILLN